MALAGNRDASSSNDGIQRLERPLPIGLDQFISSPCLTRHSRVVTAYFK